MSLDGKGRFGRWITSQSGIDNGRLRRILAKFEENDDTDDQIADSGASPAKIASNVRSAEARAVVVSGNIANILARMRNQYENAQDLIEKAIEALENGLERIQENDFSGSEIAFLNALESYDAAMVVFNNVLEKKKMLVGEFAKLLREYVIVVGHENRFGADVANAQQTGVKIFGYLLTLYRDWADIERNEDQAYRKELATFDLAVNDLQGTAKAIYDVVLSRATSDPDDASAVADAAAAAAAVENIAVEPDLASKGSIKLWRQAIDDAFANGDIKSKAVKRGTKAHRIVCQRYSAMIRGGVTADSSCAYAVSSTRPTTKKAPKRSKAAAETAAVSAAEAAAEVAAETAAESAAKSVSKKPGALTWKMAEDVALKSGLIKSRKYQHTRRSKSYRTVCAVYDELLEGDLPASSKCHAPEDKPKRKSKRKPAAKKKRSRRSNPSVDALMSEALNAPRRASRR